MMRQCNRLPDYQLDPPDDPPECPECDGPLAGRPLECRACGWTHDDWEEDLQPQHAGR
jgi:hypothetical protein